VHHSHALKDAYEGADCSDDYSSVEIMATKVSIPALSMSCVVRQVAKFDVCPWGMIFRSRERARALRSFQINPWSPGYHLVLQCTMSGSKQSEAIGADWVIEKGSIRVGIPRDYRCPWDRKAPDDNRYLVRRMASLSPASAAWHPTNAIASSRRGINDRVRMSTWAIVLVVGLLLLLAFVLTARLIASDDHHEPF
jgi:hypothetical protein